METFKIKLLLPQYVSSRATLQGKTNMPVNLNGILPVDGGFHRLDPNNVEAEVASVSAYFRDLKSELIATINKADAVFGCVAWLTDESILEALESRENFSIVVKKTKDNHGLKARNLMSNWIKLEDLASESNYFHALKTAYGLTPGITDGTAGMIGVPPVTRLHLPEFPIGKFRELDAASAQALDVNPENKEELKYEPMLHNKFLVFAKVTFTKTTLTDVSDYYYASGYKSNLSEEMFLRVHGKPVVTPYAVWTGSFNFSAAASTHLENAVLIHNRNIAEAYFKEFSLIYYLSQSFIPPGQVSPFEI